MVHKSSSLGASISFLFALFASILVACSWKIHACPRLTSNCHVLKHAEYLGIVGGVAQLDGPVDFVYDKTSGVIYTGTGDGWIKKVFIGKSKYSKTKLVENWVNTGGRPHGLAWGRNGELIVGDAYKGLLNVSRDGRVQVLTNMAEGLKFNLTHSVDMAKDGMIYFTDTSYKYSLKDVVAAFSSPNPYGRLLRYDPITKKTKVLSRGLYSPIGVSVSQPYQNAVIFCEENRGRCTRYYIRGRNKSRTEIFIKNLPASPSNIKYDNQGPNYWIGLIKPNTSYYSAGALATTLDGKVIAHYTDFNVTCSTANTIGDHLLCPAVSTNYILKFDVNHKRHSRSSCKSPFCNQKC